MDEPTWDNITDVIRTSDDDLHSIAVALDCPVEVVAERLAEMADRALLYRWNDNGVTRYGVPRGKRRAA